jgi:hypothetical protein
MKTKWTISGNAYRFFLAIAVILTITCISCENPIIDPSEGNMDYNDEGVSAESFKVYPSGSEVYAFDGDVVLVFSAGTVPTTTTYIIESFPLDGVDLKGNNVMMRAFTLTNVKNINDFEAPVYLIIRYDLCEYNMCEPGEESEVAIFKFLGDRYAFHDIKDLGDHCMINSCKTVKTSINECGTYVVVEK